METHLRQPRNPACKPRRVCLPQSVPNQPRLPTSQARVKQKGANRPARPTSITIVPGKYTRERTVVIIIE